MLFAAIFLTENFGSKNAGDMAGFAPPLKSVSVFCESRDQHVGQK